MKISLTEQDIREMVLETVLKLEQNGQLDESNRFTRGLASAAIGLSSLMGGAQAANAANSNDISANHSYEMQADNMNSKDDTVKTYDMNWNPTIQKAIDKRKINKMKKAGEEYFSVIQAKTKNFEYRKNSQAVASGYKRPQKEVIVVPNYEKGITNVNNHPRLGKMIKEKKFSEALKYMEDLGYDMKNLGIFTDGLTGATYVINGVNNYY